MDFRDIQNTEDLRTSTHIRIQVAHIQMMSFAAAAATYKIFNNAKCLFLYLCEVCKTCLYVGTMEMCTFRLTHRQAIRSSVADAMAFPNFTSHPAH